jgi:hypothetical protein
MTLFSFLALVVGLEGGARCLLWYKNIYPSWQWSGDFYELTEENKIVPKRTNTVHAVEFMNGVKSIDFVFNQNSKGIRISHFKKARTTQTTFLAGGSVVMGQGVSDSETLSSNLNKESKDREYINLGAPGMGVNYFLELMETEILGKPKKPTLIFLYQDILIGRGIAGVFNFTYYRQHLPIFNLVEGKVKKVGTPKDLSPFWNFMFRNILSKSKIRFLLAYTEVSFSIDDIKSFAAQVKELKFRFLNKFPGGEFKIISFPRYSFRYGKKVEKELKKRDIVLENLGVIHTFTPVSRFDFHPNAETIKQMSKSIKYR